MSRPSAIALAVLIAACASSPLFAETTEILATGPDRATGVPYLSPNVIPYYTVTYRSAQKESGSSGTAHIVSGTSPDVRILFTDTAVVAYSEWKAAPCGLLRTLSVRDRPPVLYYRSTQGWSLFFVFPQSGTTPCSFVTVFLERFNYFLGITRDSPLSSFPAVLNVP